MIGEHPRKTKIWNAGFQQLKHRGSSVMVWAATSWCSAGPITTFHGRVTARSTWTGWVIRCIPWSRCYFRTTMQFSKTTMPPFTQLELFIHGLRNMKVNFNIFPGQHNHRWGTDSHLQRLYCNLKKFFKKIGIKLRYRLFETCTSPLQEVLRLYCRQEVVQHHINKETCAVSVVGFHYFVKYL
jgi:hypothetical protein